MKRRFLRLVRHEDASTVHDRVENPMRSSFKAAPSGATRPSAKHLPNHLSYINSPRARRYRFPTTLRDERMDAWAGVNEYL